MDGTGCERSEEYKDFKVKTFRCEDQYMITILTTDQLIGSSS